MGIPLYIYPFVSDRCEGWFWFGAAMDNVMLWTLGCAFLCEHMFSVLLDIYLREELLGHGDSVFNSLRNCQAVFPQSYPIFCCCQQWMRFPISPPSHQHLFSFFMLKPLLILAKGVFSQYTFSCKMTQNWNCSGKTEFAGWGPQKSSNAVKSGAPEVLSGPPHALSQLHP